jgi:hypothetical protein
MVSSGSGRQGELTFNGHPVSIVQPIAAAAAAAVVAAVAAKMAAAATKHKEGEAPATIAA